jgi:CrcB protein
MISDRRELGAIFLGGMVGALLRVWLSRQFAVGADSWPWPTFLINISGSLLLGYLITRLQERLPQSTYRRPLLGTGFCGAYTTFSTLQIEVLKMAEHHHYGLALAYAAASITSGFIAVWVATATVRRVRVIV